MMRPRPRCSAAREVRLTFDRARAEVPPGSWRKGLGVGCVCVYVWWCVWWGGVGGGVGNGQWVVARLRISLLTALLRVLLRTSYFQCGGHR
jgi:hypothetical protein